MQAMACSGHASNILCRCDLIACMLRQSGWPVVLPKCLKSVTSSGYSHDDWFGNLRGVRLLLHEVRLIRWFRIGTGPRKGIEHEKIEERGQLEL